MVTYSALNGIITPRTVVLLTLMVLLVSVAGCARRSHLLLSFYPKIGQ